MHAFGMPAGTLNPEDHSHHQQSPDIAVSFLADPTEAFFAATRPVQWGEAKPGGKLASVLELFAVANGGDDGRGGDGAGTRDGSDAFGALVNPRMILDQFVVSRRLACPGSRRF